MGRSRGGLTTKIHALTDARGLPLEFVLTPGQAGDCPVAEQLLGWLQPDTIVLADKAYDADWLRRRIEAAGAAPNIPNMVQRAALCLMQRNRYLLFAEISSYSSAKPPLRVQV